MQTLFAVLVFASLSGQGEAPTNEAALDRIIGTWTCDVAADSEARPGRTFPAHWHVYRILDGHAVQDEWRMSVPNGLVRGTAVRAYDAAADVWRSVHVDARSARAVTMEDTLSPDGRLVEIIFREDADGPYRQRVTTSFESDGQGLSQVGEASRDDGATWSPSGYGMTCRRSEMNAARWLESLGR